MYGYIYVYIYMHTYIHTYTHIFIYHCLPPINKWHVALCLGRRRRLKLIFDFTCVCDLSLHITLDSLLCF